VDELEQLDVKRRGRFAPHVFIWSAPGPVPSLSRAIASSRSGPACHPEADHFAILCNLRERPEETTMLYRLVKRLVREEQGGEVLEYALIAGLIVVAAIGIISAVGTKVLARWTSLRSSI
jgi:pilus assembly protein Flp/PilA